MQDEQLLLALLRTRRVELRALARLLSMPSRANKTKAKLQQQRRQRREDQRFHREHIRELEKQIVIAADIHHLGPMV